jgi:ribosomal protein S20
VAKTADRAASSGTIHRNKAARIKSRMSARLLAASKGGAAKPRKTAKSEA